MKIIPFRRRTDRALEIALAVALAVCPDVRSTAGADRSNF